MSNTIKPVGDHILIKPAETANEIGGIIIPETAKETPQEGVVISSGCGFVNRRGVTIPTGVSAGDRVIYYKNAGTSFKIEGVDYKILSSHDLLALVG